MKNPYFPTGDDLAQAVTQRARELSLPLLQLPPQRTAAHIKAQVKWIISQLPNGNALLLGVQAGEFDAEKETLDIGCSSREIATQLKDLYLEGLKRWGIWQQLPKVVFFYFPGCRAPFRVSYRFASNAGSQDAGTHQSSEEALPHLEPTNWTPQDQSEETFLEIRQSPLPASLLSMDNLKVLQINPLVLTFVNERYDKIIGHDVRYMFERRDDLVPDSVANLHERLKKQKALYTTLRSFRSSGAFGTYYGTFKFRYVWGVPCRLSLFEGFDLAAI